MAPVSQSIMYREEPGSLAVVTERGSTVVCDPRWHEHGCLLGSIRQRHAHRGGPLGKDLCSVLDNRNEGTERCSGRRLHEIIRPAGASEVTL